MSESLGLDGIKGYLLGIELLRRNSGTSRIGDLLSIRWSQHLRLVPGVCLGGIGMRVPRVCLHKASDMSSQVSFPCRCSQVLSSYMCHGCILQIRIQGWCTYGCADYLQCSSRTPVVIPCWLRIGSRRWASRGISSTLPHPRRGWHRSLEMWGQGKIGVALWREGAWHMTVSRARTIETATACTKETLVLNRKRIKVSPEQSSTEIRAKKSTWRPSSSSWSTPIPAGTMLDVP